MVDPSCPALFFKPTPNIDVILELRLSLLMQIQFMQVEASAHISLI